MSRSYVPPSQLQPNERTVHTGHASRSESLLSWVCQYCRCDRDSTRREYNEHPGGTHDAIYRAHRRQSSRPRKTRIRQKSTSPHLYHKVQVHHRQYAPTQICSGYHPPTVSHAFPSGTSHSPAHPHSQSTSRIVARCASMNVESGQSPGGEDGHPRMPVSGTGPSLTTIRMWDASASSEAGHERTSVASAPYDRATRTSKKKKRTLELDVGRKRREIG